jgi:Leucine-rich repeat (LRR) protein
MQTQYSAEEVFFKVKFKGEGGTEQNSYRVKKGDFLYIQNDPLIPFLYRGGNPVTWKTDSEGRIIINRRTAGFMLDDLNLSYLKEHRDAEFLVYANKNRLPKAVIQAISENLERKIYISLQGYSGPSEDLAVLADINDKIVFLSLRDSTLSKLNKDIRLTYLNVLDFFNSKLQEKDILRIIGDNLIVRLNLGKTAITKKGLIDLIKLQMLQHLNLSTNNLEDFDLEFLNMFRNLESLDISRTKITDNFLKSLAFNITLQDISLQETAISDKGIEYLKDLAFLKRLDLSGVKFGENPSGFDALSNLPRLQILILKNAAINKKVLDYVSKCQLLKVLDITATGIEDHDLARLQEMYGLLELYCGENPLTGDALKYIKGIPNLKLLDLTATSIGGPQQQYLRQLETIETLYLGGTEFDDNGMEHIKALPMLTELDASNTLVTKKSIEVILKMPALRRIYLNGSKFTSADITSLRKQSPIMEVHFEE